MPKETVYKPVESIKPIYAGGTITPPKFMPTYFEFLFKNAIQIIKNITAVTGQNLIYTIPKNYRFYLTYAHVSIYNTSPTGYGSGLIHSGSNSILRTQTGKFVSEPAPNDTITANFSYPIVFAEDESIYLNVTTLTSGTAVINGFLVKIGDIPTF